MSRAVLAAAFFAAMIASAIAQPVFGVRVVDARGGGALVTEVIPGSPAALLGLEIGAVIRSVDGTLTNTADEYLGFEATVTPGLWYSLGFEYFGDFAMFGFYTAASSLQEIEAGRFRLPLKRMLLLTIGCPCFADSLSGPMAVTRDTPDGVIRRNDVLVAINGIPISTPSDWSRVGENLTTETAIVTMRRGDNTGVFEINTFAGNLNNSALSSATHARSVAANVRDNAVDTNPARSLADRILEWCAQSRTTGGICVGAAAAIMGAVVSLFFNGETPDGAMRWHESAGTVPALAQRDNVAGNFFCGADPDGTLHYGEFC